MPPIKINQNRCDELFTMPKLDRNNSDHIESPTLYHRVYLGWWVKVLIIG